jgi:hypothetical protein
LGAAEAAATPEAAAEAVAAALEQTGVGLAQGATQDVAATTAIGVAAAVDGAPV